MGRLCQGSGKPPRERLALFKKVEGPEGPHWSQVVSTSKGWWMTPGSSLSSPLCLSLTSRSPVAKTASICLRWEDHNWLPVWFLLLKHQTSTSVNEERMLKKHFTHPGGRGGWLEHAQLDRSLARAASTQLLQEGQQDTILGVSDPHTPRAWLPCRKINGDNCGSP